MSTQFWLAYKVCGEEGRVSSGKDSLYIYIYIYACVHINIYRYKRQRMGLFTKTHEVVILLTLTPWPTSGQDGEGMSYSCTRYSNAVKGNARRLSTDGMAKNYDQLMDELCLYIHVCVCINIYIYIYTYISLCNCAVLWEVKQVA